jgi:ParB family chromosome partitioning protein
MTQPKRGLGRGLDALFGGGGAPSVEPPPQRPQAAPEVEPEAPPEEVSQPLDERVATPLPPEPVAPAPVFEAAPATAAPAPQPAPIRHAEPEPIRHAYEAAPPPAPAPVAPVAEAPTPTPIVRRGGPDQIDIDLISPNPEQPRTYFEPEKLRELSDSIREHGIIQPLIVSRDSDGAYRLIAGERRLQAARLVGLDAVPVVVREVADDELLELALIENIQRADLNPIEEAMAYRRLTEEYALTQEEAARRVGKSRVTVSNALRLLQLEGEIRRSLVSGEISEGHARALLGLPEGRGRVNAWREVVKRRLSVRDTEGYVRRTLTESPATASSPGAITARRDAAISDIEARLRRALSTRVTVQPQKKGARITIECFSNEEFENVIGTLLGDYA